MADDVTRDDPTDLKNKGDIRRLLSPNQEQGQSLRGFEDTYGDIVDYIVRITHRIWEEGDMGYIYDTYAHNCLVHTGYGTSCGVEEVVSSSIAVLAAFPDRRIYADDVVWSGDDARGFHTSHLITTTGTNLGYSPWGPPKNRRTTYRAIAHCFVRENRILEEWLVRDTAAALRQLGFDPWEVARRIKKEEPQAVYGEPDRLPGQLPPPPYAALHEGEHPEDLARRFFHEVWNGRHFNLIGETHAEGAVMHVPNFFEVRGVNHIRAYLLGLLAMFPDAALTVEHVQWLGDDAEGYRVAVRWRLAGSHQRYGWFGAPTGKRVNVLGISHLHLKDGKIRQHFLVYDELALIAQLV